MQPPASEGSVRGVRPVLVFAVLALALGVRVLHLSSALQSPLSFQPGPDEDYYLRFGMAVASGGGAETPEFTFMDPGYGYLLGAVFKLMGANAFAVYLLQALLDTATAGAIWVAGRQLGRPRAGLWGALLYAVTSTAIMFCAALLKETCVAAFMAWWVVGALAVIRSGHRRAWLAFGVLCGIGVALRSTLLVLGIAALFLPAAYPIAAPVGRGRIVRGRVAKAALVAAGLILALIPWAARNFQAFGSFSPLPHNGGIVLHQVYNRDNPQSTIWIPAFVNYSHPSEIWRGYAAEAERVAGRSMSPPEIDRYWRSEALAFMTGHPGEVAADIGHKSLTFLADTEIPNNRSSVEERMFSPVLRALPPPMAWLLAMGLAGLVALGVNDRRWPIVAAPIIVAWLTVAVFWAEDRFRFHAAPILALCGGIWIEKLIAGVAVNKAGSGLRANAAYGLLAAAILGLSMLLGMHMAPPTVRWDHIVWGYIKMGRPAQARTLAVRVLAQQPDNAPIAEALGYLAAADRNYDEAAREYKLAVTLRPRSYLAHYNLARALLALGRRDEAAGEARLAMDLNPSADVQKLLDQASASGPNRESY